MLYGELPVVTTDSGTLSGVTVKVQNPPKTAVLGLPTNQQMLDRLDQQKSIRRTIGRRKSQTEFVPNPKADLDLFNKIRQDKNGLEFDEYEAGNAVSKLTYCEVTDCQRVGDEYRITLKTPFGETVHVLGIPTQRDITLYRRTVVSATDLPHGQEELRYRIGPAVALYDSVASKIEGYTDSFKPADAPPHHKSAVVVELVQAIDESGPGTGPKLLAPDEWPNPVPLRLLIYRSVRVARIVRWRGERPDAAAPNANDVTCQTCGTRREVDDTAAPGKCPKCGSGDSSS